MKNFQKILEFQKLLKTYNGIYRDVASLHKEGAMDNDIEHSYRVAMLCWMIIEEYKLKLDIGTVLKYALVHDLVEIYAGDKSIYENYSQKQKEIDEHKSFLKLKKSFPKLKSLWKTIDDYEKRTDEESQFVYLIEKLEPIFIVILSEKDHWKKRGVGFDDFIERKQKKIKHLDISAQMFNAETMQYLKKYRKTFFDF